MTRTHRDNMSDNQRRECQVKSCRFMFQTHLNPIIVSVSGFYQYCQTVRRLLILDTGSTYRMSCALRGGFAFPSTFLCLMKCYMDTCFNRLVLWYMLYSHIPLQFWRFCPDTVQKETYLNSVDLNT